MNLQMRAPGAIITLLTYLLPALEDMSVSYLTDEREPFEYKFFLSIEKSKESSFRMVLLNSNSSILAS